jgi:hypothetical protein
MRQELFELSNPLRLLSKTVRVCWLLLEASYILILFLELPFNLPDATYMRVVG